LAPYFEAAAWPLLYNIDEGQDQALAIVIEDLWSNPNATELKVFYRAFHLLPERLGKSRVLDSAIRCFSLHHLGRINDDERLIYAARSSYVEGLSRLQRALGHRKYWSSSETFSAAMVLCLYEMFVCPTSYDGWMKHAAGMARLAQLRGPESFMNPFDIIMFVAFRGIWVMDALFNNKDTFLREPRWQKVTEEKWDPSTSQEQHELMEEMSLIIAFFPALVRDGIQMRDLSAQGYIDFAQVVDLTNRALELYCRLKTWDARWTACVGPPEDVPSPTGDAMFPTVSKYPSFAIGTIYCGYYACRIIVHEVLKACKYQQDFSADNAELVGLICKAVEYNGAGTFGPYRMGFSIRIAMEVASHDVKRWIINWLEQASRIYAVVTPANFPKLEDKSMFMPKPFQTQMEGSKKIRRDILLYNEPETPVTSLALR
jgi:hypothetical protein